MKKVLLSVLLVPLFTILFSQESFGFTFGGEIPWPLSNQHVVTVSNSRGLWQLENKSMSKLFNVEMKAHVSGYNWIRISELDPKTYEVISWGEGFFDLDIDTSDSQSSFSNILVESDEQVNDRFGRYITMYPNGDLHAHPYLIRIVEVETSIGNVLGMSVLDYRNYNFTHLLGKRVLLDPLSCREDIKRADNLKCFLPTDHGTH